MVRTSRDALKQETKLREQTESRLNDAANELRDLEDQFELGQNKLTTTTKELESTRSTLKKTENDLIVTSTSLKELQEERKSLRKLGKAAWSLSRSRVGKRIRGLTGRLKKESDDSQ